MGANAAEEADATDRGDTGMGRFADDEEEAEAENEAADVVRAWLADERMVAPEDADDCK